MAAPADHPTTRRDAGDPVPPEASRLLLDIAELAAPHHGGSAYYTVDLDSGFVLGRAFDAAVEAGPFLRRVLAAYADRGGAAATLFVPDDRALRHESVTAACAAFGTVLVPVDPQIDSPASRLLGAARRSLQDSQPIDSPARFMGWVVRANADQPGRASR